MIRTAASGLLLVGTALIVADPLVAVAEDVRGVTESAAHTMRPEGAMRPVGPIAALGLEGPAADRVLRERSQARLADPAQALRAAIEALEAGDRAHARWLLVEVMQRHPIIADHAAALGVRVLLEDDEPKAAAALARKAAQEHAQSRLVGRLHAELGEALADMHDEEGARAAWTAALGEVRDDAERARLLLSIAASEERSGLDAEAAITYRLIWYAHPTTDEAKLAQHRLELLETFLGESFLTADYWRRRGNRLYAQRDNDGALEAFDIALGHELSASVRRAVVTRRAETLFRLRRYPEALAAFEALPQKGDIPIWRARSMARAGQVMEAIDAFQEIAREHPRLRARATYLSALLLDGRDFHEEARVLFEEIALGHGRSGLGNAAAWRLGWSAYRDGRDADAIEQFDRLLSRGRLDEIGQLRSRYWRARALERSGEPGGRAELDTLARDYPLSYYGWRAGERVRNERAARLAAGASVAVELEPEGLDRTQSPAADERLSPGPRGLTPSATERARILLAAGLEEAARDELAAMRRQARGLADRLELAELLIEAGDHHAAQKIVVIPYTALLAGGPQRGHEELWWHAWPSAFEPYVDAATAEGESVPPELVWAIMREESGYRPEVISPVGARGLMQIMVPTGERLARDRGLRTFEADDLFRPETNILLGSQYLTELSRLFRGQASSSIASYNAGPEAVATWDRTAGSSDDEWVESIPYNQTRSYVKRVLRSLHAYRVLY